MNNLTACISSILYSGGSVVVFCPIFLLLAYLETVMASE